MKKLDKKNVDDIYGLTAMQEGMLYHYLLDPEAEAYNEQLCLRVSGDIREEIFEKAWDVVTGANEALRTVFRWEKTDHPIQAVLKQYKPLLRYHDLSEEVTERRDLRLEEIKTGDREEKFDLRNVAFRLTLCKLGQAQYEIIISNHHILYDGWSSGIILREFFRAYNDLLEGRTPQIPVKTKFKSFIKRLREQDRGGSEVYWKEYLKGFDTLVELPVKEKKQAANTSGKYIVRFPGDFKEHLDTLVREFKVTPASVFYAAWGILLQRYNNSPDVLFGVTVSGRSSGMKGIGDMVGLFINTLPLRVKSFARQQCSEILNAVDRDIRTFAAYENTPLTDIKEYAGISNKREIFDTLVVVDNYPLDTAVLQRNRGFSIESYSVNEMTHYPITVGISLYDNIQVVLGYDEALFPADTVQRMAGHYKNILATVVSAPGTLIEEIDLLTEEERDTVLNRFNRPAQPYHADKTIHELFEGQAASTPDRIAVVGKVYRANKSSSSYKTHLSYGQLSRDSDRVARDLQDRGVWPGDIVGIKVERSVEMIIGMLAVLKAGGAYLPIDPDYPEERIHYMLEDSAAKLLLTTGDIVGAHPAARTSRPAASPESTSLAYIIYTSGSTGRPKGVLIEHRNVTAYAQTTRRLLNLTAADIRTQQSSFSFDQFVEEVYPIFFSGGKLILLGKRQVQDIGFLRRILERECVTVFSTTPPVLNEINKRTFSRSLRAVIVGGDVLKREHFSNIPSGVPVYNFYGPTETTVCATDYDCRDGVEANIPIGRPKPNYRVLILDRNGLLQPVGVPGEICIGGAGVARGYLNRPELTAERFFTSLPLYPSTPFYRTGDLGRWLPDGNILYLGRMDHQVKIRGFRVELGEIENQLTAHNDIKESVVIVRGEESGEPYLCAYIVPEGGTGGKETLSSSELRRYLSRRLPDYMVPAFFVRLEEIPFTPVGKVDRSALAASGIELESGVDYVAPGSDVEKTIAAEWREVLQIEKVGINDNFFDRGGNSLSILRLSSRLSKVLNVDIPVVTLFNYPTVASLARHLDGEEKKTAAVQPGKGGIVSTSTARTHGNEIAVIGMAGRFPRARDIHEFWNRVKEGDPCITFFNAEESEGEIPGFVPAKGVLDNKYCFDSSFFGYTPAEAAMMDPQGRIFHECTWEALANAGYDPGAYGGSIGLYAGAGANPFWAILPLKKAPAVSGGYPEQWNALQFSDKDNLSTRIAYKLGLTGPAVTVQTACSTSLVAVVQACQALACGMCDMALAGGVSVTLHDETGYPYHEGTIMSPDGYCRAFDAAANGTVGGNGVGVVVLKPLKDALADNDTVYAVIKGFGLTNDGRNKAGFTAPGVEGQARAITMALRMAQVEAESIGYIEAHGTGTPLGDPIEIAALKQAFNTRASGEKNYCAVGSAKPNIGHLDAAAGVAGFIKAVSALKHRVIPPLLHFQQPNPACGFGDSPFYLTKEPILWQDRGYPLRAGVSSFGLGGTNAHVVLEEAPPALPVETAEQRDYSLLVLSARTPSALTRMSANLGAFLRDNPLVDLPDAAYTLQVGRRAFLHRQIFVSADTAGAAEALARGDVQRSIFNGENPAVIFMFSGQGSQYVNMCRDLYEKEPRFRREVDRCFQMLEEITGRDMKPVLYPGEKNGDTAEAEMKLGQFLYTTPVKFIFEYSLAVLLMEWGIRPFAMIGHSFGEYVAACLAGVFTLEEGLYLAALRGELMHRLPEGAMLSVPLSEQELLPQLPPRLSLAAVNGESLCVVSGPVPDVESFETRLAEKGIDCLRFHVPRAGHSWMVEPIMAEFREKIAHVVFKKPRIPYVSGLTGKWISEGEAMDPGYWTRHLRETIRFADGLTTLFEVANPLFLQVGPGRGLTLFVNRHPKKKPYHDVLNLVRHHREKVSDVYYTLEQVGRLWLKGVAVDWPVFAGAGRKRIPLPGYSFEPTCYYPPADLFSLSAEGSAAFFPPPPQAPAYTEEPIQSPSVDNVEDADSSPLEKTMVNIWRELLGHQSIGTQDDFFALGGDSLKAVIAISAIHRELGIKIPLKEFFDMPTIARLANYIQVERGGTGETFSPVKPVEKREYYPLSSAQLRMYVLSRLDDAGVLYNVPLVVELRGVLDLERFEETFKILIRRHESLRTSFHLRDGVPVQVIHDHVEFGIEYFDGAAKNAKDREEDFVKPFDLSQAPLIRVGLITVETVKHILVTDTHHIIADGISGGMLIREFMVLYGDETLPPLSLHYKDYVLWQELEKTGPRIKQQEAYWLERLSGELPLLELPVDFPGSRAEGFAGRAISFEIAPDETRALKQWAFSLGGTLFMVLSAVYNVLLARLAGREEVVIGTPVSGRRHADVQGMIGMFVNSLAIRSYPVGDKTFETFFAEVKQAALGAFENQDYPFEDLVEKLNVPRDTGRNPVFDTMFSLLNIDLPEIELPGLKLLPVSYDPGTAKFDLTLTAVEKEGLLFSFEYRTALFREETVQRFTQYFKNLVTSVLAGPDQPIARLEMLPTEEREQLLRRFNDGQVTYPTTGTIPNLFREQAARSGRSIALAKNNKSYLSYNRLNSDARRLAQHLVEKGITANELVGIMAERSVEMIIGILAVLMAGGAYVPLNPAAPPARNTYILAECRSRLLLTTRELSSSIHFEGEIITIDDFQPCSTPRALPVIRPENYAYVIFTSGSTGKPKGVPITHANLSPLLYWGYQHLGIGSTDRTLHNLAYYFDWSVWEIFITLTTGACLYIVPDEVLLNPEVVIEFIRTHGITVLHATPSQYRYLALYKAETLKYLCIGAELLTRDLVEQAFTSVGPECRVFNMYGPTEATIISAVLEIHRSGFESLPSLSGVPIGVPTANFDLLVLDKYMNVCPANVVGELYIAGDGLSNGYLCDPEKTANVFVDNTYRNQGIRGTRLYKTGDLVRRLPDGNFQYLGRIDQQVKIRGFRIELGEIESLLLKYPGVTGAVVVDQKTAKGDPYLCAYVTGVNDTAALKEYLSRHLPDYMIPAYFVGLDVIPLNPNGKVDRRALPDPDVNSEESFIAPRDENERRLARIWADVLHISLETIGIHDNFFERGGHSIKATVMGFQVSQAFAVEMPLSRVFKTPTINGINRWIQSAAEVNYPPIPLVETREYYPLSFAQERMYVLYQMETGSVNYNIPAALLLEGSLEKEKLESVFKELIQRHESFRTSFHMIEEQPVQRIHARVDFTVDYFDGAAKNAKYREGDFVKPFDLSQAPLLRVGLIKEKDDVHIMIVDMHHIISDGVSVAVLVEEFLALYSGQLLPPLKTRYVDYSLWQKDEAQQALLKEQETFWLAQFEGDLPHMNLPVDFQRPAVSDFSGDIVHFQVAHAETEVLKTLAAAEGCSLFMVLLAAWNVFLSRISGSENIVTGTPVAGRGHPDLLRVIGMFVNTLALRGNPEGHLLFDYFLGQVRDRTLEAFENQDYPFEVLVDRLPVERDTGRNPVFDVMFVFQNVDIPALAIPGLTLSPYDLPVIISKFDLTLQAEEVEGHLQLSLEYSTALFKRETVQRFAVYFQNIVSSIIREPGQEICRLDMLPEAEKEQLLVTFNRMDVPYPEEKTIPQLFEEQAVRTGDTVALVGETQVTYRQLNEHSDRLAWFLQNKGVGPDTITAIKMERSVEMIVGILGILKAGGAYLPIDPTYPEDRITFMLEDSSAQLLLTVEDIVATRQPATRNPLPVTSPGSLAYVIYTSGTTGKPKGTLIEHRNLAAYVFSFLWEFEITEKDIFIQQASYAFDTFAEEVYPALLRGARIVLPSVDTVRDIYLLSRFISRHQVTMISCSPLLLNELNKDSVVDSIHTFISGGDVLKPEYIGRLLKTGRVYNTYGPTETTVCTSYYTCGCDEAELTPNIPIGKPAVNYRVYILDKNQALVPLGVPGEICIAGVGVARGYLNRPELTAEKFFTPLPLYLSTPLYLTGDLGRWLPDGNIEFLGRIDHQVKIRGYRIELGEIESQLIKCEQVNEAVVTAREDKKGEKYLCAYIVPVKPVLPDRSNAVDVARLKEDLSTVLPGYMIPPYFVVLEKLPLTPNGKIDRKALPGPDAVPAEEEYAPPESEVEKKLVRLWSEILDIEENRISVHADFFQLGGHSLKATVLISKIHRVFNVRMQLVELFRAPFIRDMARYIEHAVQDTFTPIRLAGKKEFYPLSSAQKRLYILQQLESGGIHYNIPDAVRLEGLLDRRELEETFKALIRRHEGLRTSFQVIDGKPFQKISENVEFAIEYFDGAAKNAKDREEGRILRSFVRPFDLSQAPLLRVGLIKEKEDVHIMIVDMHHIISDGASTGILIRDFMALYAGETLPPLPIQYKDYSQWQEKEKETAVMKKQESFWLKELSGDLPRLNLPYDYSPTGVTTFEGGRFNFEIPSAQTARLNQLAAAHGTTLYVVVMAVFNVMLYILTGKEDIILGTPIANRRHADLSHVIGMFVNTLAIRNFPGGSMSFAEFLRVVRDRTLTAHENQEYPFEDLVEKVVGDKTRDAGRNPVFDVLYLLQNVDMPELSIEGLHLTPIELDFVVSPFDLVLLGYETGTGAQAKLALMFLYRSKLFKEETIQRFARYLREVTDAVSADETVKIKDIEISHELVVPRASIRDEAFGTFDF